MLGGGPTDAAQTAGPALDGEDLWIHAEPVEASRRTKAPSTSPRGEKNQTSAKPS